MIGDLEDDSGQQIIDVATALNRKADKVTTHTKTDVDGLLEPKAFRYELTAGLGLKANDATTYNKTEVNDFLAPKATRAEVTSGLNSKADKETTYSKTEVSELLVPKANATDVYSKAALNPLLDSKVDDDEFLTDIDLKANKTYVDTQLATKATPGYVDQKVTDSIALVVNSAPQALTR